MKRLFASQWLALVAAATLGLAAIARADSPMLNAPAPTATQQRQSSLSLNPDLSFDGLFGLSQFNRDEPLVFDGGHDPKRTGFNLQQAELTLAAAVDPYFTAQTNIVLAPENGGALKVEVEEAYATTTSLPWNLQVKAGQFFTAFGRFNPTHPHQWDFVNKPLVTGRFFGGDGLRNPGAQLSWLSPLPWYSELIASAQNATGETATSFRPVASARQRSAKDLLTTLRWANFFTLTDSLLLNAGVSWAQGPSEIVAGDLARTRILGADLYLKFRETSALSFFSLQAEALRRYLRSDVSDWGAYAQLNHRLGEQLARWHAGLRFDVAGPNRLPGAATDLAQRWRLSPVVTYYPSEFSKVRFQYDHDKPDDFNNAQKVGTIQFEFAMGAHGAHAF